MNREAIQHLNTENFVYPVSRNRLVFKIRAARKDIVKCLLIYWDRAKPENKKQKSLKCCYRDGLFDYFQGEVSFHQIARYQKYYFELTDALGKQSYFTANGLREDTPDASPFEYLYTNDTDVISPPQWAKGIVYYQIFPERFRNGNSQNDPQDCSPWGTLPTRENYMGGDLEGILQKIDYLKELGVECIYLNPIFCGDFNHKYATTDYFQVDSIFGSAEVFAQLVERCHEASIRIVLDGVFNHTGIHFSPFEDVMEKQEKSKYTSWFHITHYPITCSHHDYECVGAYKWMPKLNTANPEVREFIIRVMLYWIETYGIDGWRLDVADELDPSVWEEARVRIKEKYPDKMLIGETWGYGGRLLRGNQMDAVMNYVFRDAVRDYFAQSSISVSEFDSRLNHMLAFYKDETNQVMYNLLDSHDTERFLYLCGEKKELLKLAIAFQMLFPGAPAIYYGDEVGMTGNNDPDCRRCMEWGEHADKDLLQWYKQFIKLRKTYRSIRMGDFRSTIVDEATNTYGFVRTGEEESCYIVFHKGEEACSIECPVLEKGKWMDLLSGEEIPCEEVGEMLFFNADITEYQGKLKLQMSPYSVKVIMSLHNSNKKIGGCLP